MDEKPVPNIVKALAQQVGMTPLDWAEHPDKVVIVFVEGAKMTFDREQVAPMIQKLVRAKTQRTEIDLEPLSAPPAPSTEPLFDAPPIQSSPETQTERKARLKAEREARKTKSE